MIQIFHYNSLTKAERDKLNSSDNGWDSSPRFTRYANITMSAKPADVAIGLLSREYHLVAVIDSDSLNAAFAGTNHIESDWTENVGVTALPGRHRSTSVGDIFTRNGATYIVAPSGFTILTSGVE